MGSVKLDLSIGSVKVKKKLNFGQIAKISASILWIVAFAVCPFFPDNRFCNAFCDCTILLILFGALGFSAKCFIASLDALTGVLLQKYDANIARIELEVHFCGMTTAVQKFVLMDEETLATAKRGDVVTGFLNCHPRHLKKYLSYQNAVANLLTIYLVFTIVGCAFISDARSLLAQLFLFTNIFFLYFMLLWIVAYTVNFFIAATWAPTGVLLQKEDATTAYIEAEIHFFGVANYIYKSVRVGEEILETAQLGDLLMLPIGKSKGYWLQRP